MSTSTEIPQLESPLKPCLPKELVSSTAFLLARVGVAIKMRVLDELGQAGCGGYGYGVLATLEKDGLVERKRDAHDRRRHAVSITAEGKRQLVRLRSTVREIEESFLEPLDEETRKAFHEALFSVASNLDPRYTRPS